MYLDGTKKHSIRAGNRWKDGMSIQFFQDTRTKNMKKFMPDGKVVSVQDIFMTYIQGKFEISIDDKLQFGWACRTLIAQNDGFDTDEDMRNFFFPKGCKHDVWSGQIIHWTDLKY